MGVECQIKNRNLIVTLRGDLDHHNAKFVREKIDSLLKRNNLKNVIFDFANMDFMDSSGIGVIMGRYKNLQSVGGKVAVANVSPSIDRIFNISGLYKIISKCTSVNEALKSL
ncbi:MAG: anti-sigma F factor antagonist [Eubacteriales bacterium]